MAEQAREERIALNESRFREINDRVRQDVARLRHVPERLDFVCECANLDCREQISLTDAEYEAVRSDPELFAIAIGHEFPAAEDVVEITDRYAVVRKHPNVRHIVEETDPRPDGPSRA